MSQQVNLLNLGFRKQTKIFGAKTMAQALLLFVAGMAILAFIGDEKVKGLQNSVSASEARLQLAKGRQVVVNAQYAPKAKNKDLEAQIAAAEGELRVLQTVAGILERGEFGNTRGFSEYYRAFARQNLPGMWLTSVQVTGVGSDIVVEGRTMQAELVPAFITALKAEPVMKGKSFGGMRVSEVMQRKIDKGEQGERIEKQVRAPFVAFSLQTNPIAGAGAGQLAQGPQDATVVAK